MAINAPPRVIRYSMRALIHPDIVDVFAQYVSVKVNVLLESWIDGWC